MNRTKMYRVSSALFAVSLTLSLLLGCGLDSIRRLSVLLVDRMFPVAYQVEYPDPASAQPVLLTGAAVYVRGDTAVVSFGRQEQRLALESVRLTCSDPAALLRNRDRAFFLAVGLLLLFCAAVLWMLSLAVRLRVAARRRTSRRPAHRPCVPMPGAA